MDKVRQWMYYFLIGIISLIALCFLPLIGSSAGLGWNLPNTTVGWVVWITTKTIVAVLNVLIFHCFMLQAKINIKDNSRYIEAQEILRTNQVKEYVPRSPSQWNKKQYGTKGVTIFITTGLSTVALTQAMLTFDWMSMLTYLVTIIMGLIFGIMQMKTAEDYWTDEFWQYAQQIKKDMEVVKTESTEQGHASVHTDRRTDILESGYMLDPTSLTSKPVVVDCSWSDMRFLGRSVHTSDTTSDRTDTIHKKIDD